MNEVKCYPIFLLALAVLIVGGCKEEQQNPLRLAAASSWQMVLPEVVEGFKKECSCSVEIQYASTGKLVSQIENGGNYDGIVSANPLFTNRLFKKGFLTKKASPIAYGQLVLVFHREIDWKSVEKVGMPNPSVAPFGMATAAYLQNTGFKDSVQVQWVYGQNVGQVNHFLYSGAIQAGFSAYSRQLEQKLGDHYQFQKVGVPNNPDLLQTFGILGDKGKSNTKAESFLQYLQSDKAKQLLKNNGLTPFTKP